MPKNLFVTPKVWAFSQPTKTGIQLTGNREGLQILRKQIDEALEHGSAVCDDSVGDWSRIVVAEEGPGNNRKEPSGLSYVLGLIAVATVIGALMLVFGLGVHQILLWWKAF